MSQQPDRPSAMSAEVHILFNGYAGSRVASTVGYVQDGETRVVIDPGMVPDPGAILDPLVALGVSPTAITDVIFSHHHPDHTLHAALFPSARFHDHWAIYHGDLWISRPAEGFAVSPSILLIETPGHSPQDITTLVGTSGGIIAFTHLWWHAQGPVDDPRATDLAALHANRARVLRIPSLAQIVPGHGAPFTPDASTPR
jgi:glyoxylase-like metal-dependent hydrolase (beta-lactamase superfamily II)